ncbi:unnamed protein product [Rhizophagus irregularis]|nr:unnamed protein product [Rhizophagus irregularis]
MNEIQQAITECIEACLNEQKRGMEIKNSFRCNNKKTIWNLYLVTWLVMIAYHLIETIITSQTSTSALSQQQSPWLSLGVENTIFSVAKRRVFVRTSTTNPTDNTQKNSYPDISDIKITSGYRIII